MIAQLTAKTPPDAAPEAGSDSPRSSISPVDQPRIERAVREILAAIGEDPDRDGLLDTPGRVARAYTELFAGLRESPAGHLQRVFGEHTDELVLLRDIEFFSVCEHHLLPFVGRAHVAYLPAGNRVVGLSKLARTVDVFARRPQVQERLTSQIADALVEHLEPRGVAVIVEAEHMCMKMRGVNKAHSVMLTTAFRGELKENVDMRYEVQSLILQSRETAGQAHHAGCGC